MAELTLLMKKKTLSTNGGYLFRNILLPRRRVEEIHRGTTPRVENNLCSLDTVTRASYDYLYCQRFGHEKNLCWKRGREEFMCNYCKRNGHLEEDCRTIERHIQGPAAVNISQEFEPTDSQKSDGEIVAALQRGRDGESLRKRKDLRDSA